MVLLVVYRRSAKPQAGLMDQDVSIVFVPLYVEAHVYRKCQEDNTAPGLDFR